MRFRFIVLIAIICFIVVQFRVDAFAEGRDYSSEKPSTKMEAGVDTLYPVNVAQSNAGNALGRTQPASTARATARNNGAVLAALQRAIFRNGRIPILNFQFSMRYHTKQGGDSVIDITVTNNVATIADSLPTPSGHARFYRVDFNTGIVYSCFDFGRHGTYYEPSDSGYQYALHMVMGIVDRALDLGWTNKPIRRLFQVYLLKLGLSALEK